MPRRSSTEPSPGVISLGATRPPRPAQDWARWNEAIPARYTVGVEEEVMLLESPSRSLAESNLRVRDSLTPSLADRLTLETHAAMLEYATAIHRDVGGAMAEVADLRRTLAVEVQSLGLECAIAGTHPFGRWGGNRITDTERYWRLGMSMRSLLDGPPTLGLHVHVGVPDPDDAVRLLNAFRAVTPVLLAVSGNSPFCQGRDGGLSSQRTIILERYPRSGSPGRYRSYSDYVRSLDPLFASGAVDDPSFIWWDVRLKPHLGTVEVRLMDGQTRVAEAGALAALIQSIARLELEEGAAGSELGPELLRENRFLAARDGMNAWLVTDDGRRVAVRALFDELLERCRPHAVALGCATELAAVELLAGHTGAQRQRRWMRESGRLTHVAEQLADAFPP